MLYLRETRIVHILSIDFHSLMTCRYLDPGNYATNLQAGATNGYKLLFIVLLSGLIGIMMQILAARLGIVTGKGKPSFGLVYAVPSES